MRRSCVRESRPPMDWHADRKSIGCEQKRTPRQWAEKKNCVSTRPPIRWRYQGWTQVLQKMLFHVESRMVEKNQTKRRSAADSTPAEKGCRQVSAASRRRRQHAMGHRHLARICGGSVVGGRPIYKRRSKEFLAKKLAENIARARTIQARKGMRK